MAAHSIVGPSALSRVLNCPGSVQMDQQIQPTRTTSVYAAEGTVVHSLLENCLVYGDDPKDRIGQTVVQDNHPIPVDQSMADAVRAFETHVDSLPLQRDIWIEERVSLQGLWPVLKPAPDIFGTVDFGQTCAGDPTLLFVRDMKYGAGVTVDPENNPSASRVQR